MFFQLITNGLITGLLYALIALGFSVIYSGTRIFHIAHGAIYTLAPYFLIWSLSAIGFSIEKIGLLGIMGLICLALCFTSFGAIVIETAVYRPLLKKQASSLIYLISSLGIYIIIINTIAIISGNEIKYLLPRIEAPVQIGGLLLSRSQIIQFIIAVSSISCTLLLIYFTSIGRDIRALCDDPILLNVLGRNSEKIRLLIFIAGSSIAGLSGILSAFEVGAYPQMGLPMMLNGVASVIIGGLFSFRGAVIGALLLGLIHSFSAWLFSAEWQNAVTFIVLMGFLLIRHEGLFVPSMRVEEK